VNASIYAINWQDAVMMCTVYDSGGASPVSRHGYVMFFAVGGRLAAAALDCGDIRYSVISAEGKGHTIMCPDSQRQCMVLSRKLYLAEAHMSSLV